MWVRKEESFRNIHARPGTWVREEESFKNTHEIRRVLGKNRMIGNIYPRMMENMGKKVDKCFIYPTKEESVGKI